MPANWLEQLPWALYGLSYMVLGVAVAARAAAFASSALRNRLFGLAASSAWHAFYVWLVLVSQSPAFELQGHVRYLFEAISFIPLCYFAAGRSGPYARVLQFALGTTLAIAIWLTAAGAAPTHLQFAVHYGLALPVGIFSVHALLYDPVFRMNGTGPDRALKIAAYSLAVYTATQAVLTKSDSFPASVINSVNFIGTFGISPFAVRLVSGAVFMVAILAMLSRFDEAMRAEAEKAQRETTNALKLSEAKLADILAHSPEGIIVSDTEGRIEMFNAGAEAIFGWRADEVIGKTIEMLMPERFRSAHRAHVSGFSNSAVRNCPREGRPEVTGLRRTGEEFPLGASLSKISTPDGILITTVLRDISRQKAQERDLLEAKRAAEDSSRAKSQFIANMSHELRTPLNAIIGFSEMLDLDAFAGKRKEYAHLIRVSGEHLLNLINDILDLAKIEAGKFALRESELAFGSLAEDAAAMLAEKAKAGGISLLLDSPSGLPPVHADERALKQVLINLMGNALKFTPPGGTVRLFARIEADGKFVFGVSDTGVGISEDDQARLFKEFGQGSKEAFTGEKGTGLGLKIAKGLALAHGGTIALRSAIGQGTTFTVSLPASRVRAAVAA